VSVTSLVSCNCGLKFETITEGEIVCRKCGCVKGVESTTHVTINSKTNLYHDKQLGGRENTSLCIGKYSSSQSIELSAISNLCNILNYPQYLSHDILYWYKKIRSNIKFTKGKILVLVIYQICRYNKIPLNEKQLNSAIQSCFNTKNSYSSLKVICEANAFLDDDNVPILDKIGFNVLTDHNMNFVLRSKLKSLQGEYSNEIIENVKKMCAEIAPSISGTEYDIAKITFKKAMEKCGLSSVVAVSGEKPVKKHYTLAKKAVSIQKNVLVIPGTDVRPSIQVNLKTREASILDEKKNVITLIEMPTTPVYSLPKKAISHLKLQDSLDVKIKCFEKNNEILRFLEKNPTSNCVLMFR